MRKALTIAWLVLSGVLLGCNSRFQVRTFTAFQIISRFVANAIQEGQPVAPKVLAGAIEAVNREKRDAWGHQIHFAVHGYDWILVSSGSDGQLDLESMSQYFQIDHQDIRGYPERDLNQPPVEIPFWPE